MNLKEPFVITISREIGSGGHTAGRILAEKLNTFYFDKYLIESLEKRFNLTVSGIEKFNGEAGPGRRIGQSPHQGHRPGA